MNTQLRSEAIRGWWHAPGGYRTPITAGCGPSGPLRDRAALLPGAAPRRSRRGGSALRRFHGGRGRGRAAVPARRSSARTPAPSSKAAGRARAGGLAAILILANAIAVPAGLPTTGAGPGEVSAFFGGQSGAAGLSAALAPAAWILAVLFGAGAVAAMRRAERERSETRPLVGSAGLLLQNGAFAVVVSARLALGTTGGDASAAAGLWALHEAVSTLNGTFLALALIGLSVGGLRTGLIRPWHGTLGLVSAALLFASAALAPLIVGGDGPLGLLGPVGWLMWALWLFGYGAALLRPAAPRAAQPVAA
ncbi:hypothetical protein J0910_18540 [Nocardiopsis sp. CNT-189]|uniref:hypothetical protein n=1 Tax=Nocardiopsis oceanisediminis TaxID=2816862 RepID=UPI003B2AC7AD